MVFDQPLIRPLGRDEDDAPALARRLRERHRAVCLSGAGRDWIDTEHACGWLVHGGDGDGHDRGFAMAVQAALAQGFVTADALVLARMEVDGTLPVLDFDGDDTLPPAPPAPPAARAELVAPSGLYAICSDADAVARWAAQGVSEIQLRIKSPGGDIAGQIAASLRAVAGTASRLWINDHWRAALDAGARAIHLGQEDWARLQPRERIVLRASGVALGLSSHSLWELARARGLAPTYIACGPIHPTTTKAMPWRPQGLHNLAWWVAHAGRPVVAIGGLLTPAQVRGCAAAGAAAACLVRALDGPVPLAEFEQAWAEGLRQPPPAPVPVLASVSAIGPRPSLADS